MTSGALPPCVLVGGGKGGVGKSTVAAALAVTFQRLAGFSNVGLLDADVSGPSQNLIFSVSGPVTVLDGLMQPVISNGVHLMSCGFLASAAYSFDWTGPAVEGVVYQFLEQCNWSRCDVLVIDLPPGAGNIHLAIAEHTREEFVGLVLVTIASRLAIADMRRAVTFAQSRFQRICAFVLNRVTDVCPMSLPSDVEEGCGTTVHLTEIEATDDFDRIQRLSRNSELHSLVEMLANRIRCAHQGPPADTLLTECDWTGSEHTDPRSRT